jgi:hypothetical protein
MIKKIANIAVAGLSSSDLEINLQTNPDGTLDLCFKDPHSGKDLKLSLASFPKEQQSELEHYKDIALRSVAALDNYRRRVESEQKLADASPMESIDAILLRIHSYEERRGYQLLRTLISIVENHLKECPEIGTIDIPYEHNSDDQWEFILTHFCENLTRAVIDKRVAQCVERLQTAKKIGISFT